MKLWKTPPADPTDPIVKEARERLELCVQVEIDIRKEASIDQKFVAGKQWNPAAEKMRVDDDRPCITINKLPPFVQGISNSARLNKPSIKIVRGDNRASLDTAEVYEGLIRRIQYESSAATARNTALENAASCSMGAYRINADWEDERSRFKSLRIEPLPDPMAVYFDPAAIEYDRSDGEFAFVDSHMSKDEFKRRWPKAKLSEANFFDGEKNPAPDWIGTGTNKAFVRVPEYWTVHKFDRYLVYLSNNDNVFSDEMTSADEQLAMTKDQYLALHPEEADNEELLDKADKWVGRMSVDRKIEQKLINGVEVLETTKWPGRWIPLVPVYGKQMYVEGKREIYSVVRFMRGAQELYNFYATTEAEMISDAPKAPWIGVLGSFKSKLEDWRNAHLKKFAFLEHDPVPMRGGQGDHPAPQRNVQEPPVQALISGKLQASDEMKASGGVFDPSLGINKGDQSGVAIEQLRSEGDVTNYHFIDNLSRSEWHEGRILVDLIPHYYDTEREIEILGVDQKASVIRVNTPAPVTDEKTGKTYHHRLDQGKFKVIVKVGPSSDTRREQIFKSLMDVAKNNPAVFPMIADVMFTYSDFEGADILAQRFKASLPPALQQAGGDGKPGIPPEVQMQLQQLQQALQAATQDLANKTSEKKIQGDLEMRIAELNAFVKIRVAEITASKDADKAAADRDASMLEQMFDQAHEVALQAHAAVVQPPPQPEGATA